METSNSQLASRNSHLATGNEKREVKKPSKMFTHYYGTMILLLLALLVAAGFIVIKPKIDEYKGVTASIQDVQLQAENEKQYFDSLSRSVAAAQTIDPEVLGKVDLALPREPGVPNLLVQMDAAASANKVKISSITFSADDKKAATGKVQGLNMTMTVEAQDYQALKNFLSSLELSLRVIDIQNLSINSFSKNSAVFSLQMKTYYFPASTK